MKKTQTIKILIQSICFLSILPCFAQSENVSLEKKVAQMLIMGFQGTEISHNKEIVSDIREMGIGGVLLFERNITPIEKGIDSKDCLRKLCTDLQGLSSNKLIISIDQEGGFVNRMKVKYGFPKSETAQYLGQLNCEDSSRYYYSRMAESLKETGINVNFAPTVDLNVNPQCPINESKRIYSSSVKIVNEQARYFIEEHHKQGVKTSLKHFPGHGSSNDDSHLGFTDVTNTWKKKELHPYRYFIDNSLSDMIMISHTFNAKLDPKYPATLSKLTIDSLLRKKMGYKGVVITDDMNMKAITANYSFEEAISLTINAGVDLIILSNNISGSEERVTKKVIKIIVDIVERGAIPRQRIEESYDRIIQFKKRLNGGKID